MQTIYISRKATDLMGQYIALVEQGKAEVVLVSKQCIGFRVK